MPNRAPNGRFIRLEDRICHHCLRTFPVSDGEAAPTGTHWYCQTCIDLYDVLRTCPECGSRYENPGGSGNIYAAAPPFPRIHRRCCRSCAEHYSYSCTDCGDRFTLTDDGGSVAGSSGPACSGCYSSFSQPIVMSNPCPQRSSGGRDRSENPPAIPRYPEKPTRSILCRRPFGLEVETINAANYSLAISSLAPGMEQVYDGSINHDGYGAEIVTPILQGDDGLEVIKGICEIPLEMNNSCGIHLHIGTGDYTWRDLRKLVVFAMKLQDEIFMLVPKQRRTSRYCKKLGRAVGLLLLAKSRDEFLSSFFAISLDYMAQHKAIAKAKMVQAQKYHLWVGGQQVPPGSRYIWCNICSWYYRGTIEIRLLEGTTNYERIKHWIWLWQYILLWLEGHTMAEVVEVRLLKDILPEALRRYWKCVESLEELEKSIRQISASSPT